MENTLEIIDDLRSRNKSLEVKIQALEMKIDALEIKFTSLNEVKDILSSAVEAGFSLQKQDAAKPHQRAERALTKDEEAAKNAIEAQFRKVFKQNYSTPTYEATSSLMLCMLQNKKADAKLLLKYVNATGVTVSRYTRMLRGIGLLSFEGSKRKGTYSLTSKGEKFLAKAAA